MKSLEIRFSPDPLPPHAQILNSRRVFFAAQTSFEAAPTGKRRIIRHVFNILTVARM